MKKAGKVSLGGTVLLMICAAAFLAFAVEAGAQARAAAVQGASFNVSAPLKDNLRSLVGKDVYVGLRSGKTYQGFVKSVGDHFIHLEKLAGKEFFDALIRIDDISAIEVRFRELK